MIHPPPSGVNLKLILLKLNNVFLMFSEKLPCDAMSSYGVEEHIFLIFEIDPLEVEEL